MNEKLQKKESIERQSTQKQMQDFININTNTPQRQEIKANKDSIMQIFSNELNY